MNLNELKLNDTGAIDIAYYQRLGQQARAQAIRELFTKLISFCKRQLHAGRRLQVEPSPLVRTAH